MDTQLRKTQPTKLDLQWETLVALLRHRAQHQGDKLAYIFLDRGEVESERLTYGELDRRARAIAAQLRTQVGGGERALLLYAPGLDFVAAFFGCLYADVIAVPAYPPDPTRLNRTLPRLMAIANDAQTTMVLTTSQILPMAQALVPMAPELKHMGWLATDSVDEAIADSWEDPGVVGETIAFLQYTSGSTSTPKGVMVTHGNLMHNEEMIRRAFDQTEESVVVSWLPLYHDMGLIGHVMQPLYVGGPCILMSPIAFLKRPIRWLRAITKYRATTSTGPNFAFDLCVRKVTDEQKAELDLSSWQQALNGAEPIRAETIERFTEAFGPCGFRRETFYPCYGLAEGTLVVTGGKPQPAPFELVVDGKQLERDEVVVGVETAQRRLIAAGVNPVEDQQVLIVDPATGKRCPADRVGEIWLSGPSVAGGYWRRPEQTEESFGAALADGEGPFLRTGDLGFMRDGYLFVTGRLKDLIIIRGQNYYPQDIEWVAEDSHPLLRPGASAAFSLEGDKQETLVVVAEVEKGYKAGDGRLDVEAVADAVRQAVMRHNALYVHNVVLIAAGSIAKTSSGKIQRRACREAYLGGTLEVVGTSSMLPVTAAEADTATART